MLVEIVGATLCPVLCIVELVGNLATVVGREPAPAGVVLVAMGNELLHRLGLDELYRLASTLAVHEVTHEDAALVDEQVQQISVFQHVLDKTRCRLGKCPVVVLVFAGIVEQVDGVVVILATVESQSEVGILHDDAESLGQT